MTLKRAALATGMMLAAAPALALEDVTFGTNWLPEAEHGGYYQAVADGTYEACGLKVTIIPGGPQVNNRALMMAGKMDFNMAGNLLQDFNAVEQGIPLKVVAADFQKDPQILMTHPGKAATFADVGKLPKAFIGDNGYQSFYQWLIHDYGFKAENRVPYTFNPGPFIADENSTQQGYLTSEPYAVEKEGGFTPDIWLLADQGFNTYATLIETMQDTIDKKPEVVKCFVEGSAIGWANYLYGDPSLADAAIKADNPQMTQDQIDYSREMMKKYGIVDSGDSETLGIGGMTPEHIESFYKKMVASGVVSDGIDLSKVYTTEFSNTGAALEVKKKLLGQ